MPASGPVPILSRVQSWDTDHLAEAATNWSNTASLWEDTFAQVSQQMAYPGGMAWKGAAADVAQQRVRADEVKVLELANQLHGAAGVARSSDDQIEAAKRAVLAAVAATEEAGSLWARTSRLLVARPAMPPLSPPAKLKPRPSPPKSAPGSYSS